MASRFLACNGSHAQSLCHVDETFSRVRHRIRAFLVQWCHRFPAPGSAFRFRPLSNLCKYQLKYVRRMAPPKSYSVPMAADKNRTLLRFLSSHRVPHGSPSLCTETFTSHRRDPWKHKLNWMVTKGRYRGCVRGLLPLPCWHLRTQHILVELAIF